MTFTFEEIRRATFLNDQLTAACSKAGIMEASVLEVRGANTSQTTIKKLNDLLEESAQSVFGKQRAGKQKIGEHSDALRGTEQIDRKVGRETAQPSKKRKKKKENSAYNSSSGVSGTISVDDLLHGKAPDWVKNAPKSTPQEALGRIILKRMTRRMHMLQITARKLAVTQSRNLHWKRLLQSWMG